MHTLLVELQAIRDSYTLGKGDLTSVREATLEIDAGEFLALSGASDRGKATRLNVRRCTTALRGDLISPSLCWSPLQKRRTMQPTS